MQDEVCKCEQCEPLNSQEKAEVLYERVLKEVKKVDDMTDSEIMAIIRRVHEADMK